MKNFFILNRLFVLFSVSFLFIVSSCTKEESSTTDRTSLESDYNGKIIEGKYIVVFHDDAINSSYKSAPSYEVRTSEVRVAMAQVLSEKNIESSVMDRVYSGVFAGFSGSLSEKMVNQLRNDRRVAYIEPDRLIILAPGKPPGGGGGSTQQEIPYGITRVGGSVDGTGKTAWIIDTGIDLDHPDLNVDAGRSRTFITAGKDSRDANDANGHGTHVAGTIGAKNNSIGVVGVAANATLVAVKVLDSRGSGSYSGVIAGVDYVAGAAAAGDVANMSLGGPVSQALDDAVKNAASKGIYFALAAGNDSDNADNHSPARANTAGIFTVSAMDASNIFAYFSNFGNPPVDFCAPGVAIKSTWKDGGYNTISGTSMASPHAAGVLLITGGNPLSDGVVTGDPDGSPDPVIHR